MRACSRDDVGASRIAPRAVLFPLPRGERSTPQAESVRKGRRFSPSTEQAPIVPVAIEGFYDAWPRTKKWPKLANLRLAFGKPIVPPPVSEASEAAYEKLTAELKEQIVGNVQELRREEGSRRRLGGGGA